MEPRYVELLEDLDATAKGWEGGLALEAAEAIRELLAELAQAQGVQGEKEQDGDAAA